jgi:hypothetical protein
MYPIGFVRFNIYDINVATLITSQESTILIENSTSQRTELVNGTKIVGGFTVGEQYIIRASSPGYESVLYEVEYAGGNVSVFNIYLVSGNESPTNITYFTIDSSDEDLPEVQVVIEAFVGGVYEIIASGVTDNSGSFVFPAIQGNTHRITLSKDGFVTQQFIDNMNTNTFTWRLVQQNIYDFEGGQGSVTYSWTPVATELNISSSQQFSFTVTPNNADIQFFSITLVNGSNTSQILSSATSLNENGGTITINYDTTLLNNSQAVAYYTFRKEGDSIVYREVIYTFREIVEYSGSLLELKKHFENEVPLKYSIVIFIIIFITLIIILAIWIRGVANPLLAAMLSTVIGFLINVPLQLLALFILIIAAVALGTRRGQ